MKNERSKYLALILRHKPELVNLELMKDGWVQVTNLCNNTDFTMDELEEIVTTDTKGRYQFSEEKQFIRAVQGHSKKVDIEFKEFIPTKELYHGTADRFYSSILQEGIKKMSRQYVHLSSDIETAKLVGKRHGNVKIIIIDAIKMFKDGYKFYIADNGVILTDIVPIKYFI
jgi:putative RNA 2'-phosphotransferase